MKLWMSSLGLRGRIALTLVGFGVVPLVLLLAGYVAFILPTLKEQSFAVFHAETLELGAAINRTIGERVRDVDLATVGHPSALDPQNWRRTDGSGGLVSALNGEMRANRAYKLIMLVGTDGSVLGVNTQDSDGHSAATTPLYQANYASEGWFRQAMAGEGYTPRPDAAKFAVGAVGEQSAVRAVYGDNALVIPISAPLRDATGKVVGVWVDFLDFGSIEGKVADNYKRTDTVGGDIGAAMIEYKIVDASNRIIFSFKPDSDTEGHRVAEDYGKALDLDLAKLRKGETGSYEGVVGGRATLVAEMPATHEYPGAGWRIVMSAPEGEAFATANRITLEIAVAILLTSVVAVIAGLWSGASVAKPILALANRMRALAAGDRDTPVPYADRIDDIGQMGKAVLAFQEAAQEKDRLEAQAVADRDQAEQDRTQNEQTRAAAAREQSTVVETVAVGLSKLSDGDLTFRITQDFPGEYAKLKSDFNDAMDKLEAAMKVIVSNAEGMLSGSGEISQAADDLSRRTEQQAATLEETAAALDEITATVRRTAEGAGQANTAVVAARSDAERSGEVVRQAVSAMNEIEASAGQISQIIGVIDEIAFQTNLLALNAGVEAARAGDAGKGFAVVASEVRALAQRSAEAAKEIKGLISTSSRQVGEGVELVGQTGEALQRIVVQVAEITSLVSEIAASAQEQSTGLSQVNTAVNQMDQTTQQNAAMVEQSTAASHALAKEAEDLSRLVGRFQIGGVSGEAKAPVHEAQGRAKAFANRFARPALKTVGSSAVKAADSRPESWEEF